ncbi:MAG: PAS domain S-box protein [Candidatus Bathyarchaeia archaeon]
MQSLKGEVEQISVEDVGKEKLEVTDLGKELRKTGIDVIGDAPWGTHFCQFYQTKEDLLDVLVPYFKAGLESNEFCMWVTSEPVSEEEAKEAMRRAVPNFDRYVERGQIEIVPHTEWYVKGGVFNLQRVLSAWIDKLDQALAKGYDGIRVTGDAAWLEKRDRRNFADYEKEVNNVIGKYRMIAICTYSLDKWGASEVIDVVCNHQFALIRRRGEWELVESSELKRTKEALKDSERRYRSLVENAPVGVYRTNLQGDILFANVALARMFEFESPEEMMSERVLRRYKNPKDREVLIENLKKTGKVDNFELEVLTKTGRPKNVILSAFLDGDAISGMIIDITQRKQMEEALRKSEEKFRKIFENASDAIIYLDRSGRILDVNEKAVEVFGGTKRELLGRHFVKVGVFSLRDIPTLMSNFANILAGKTPTLDVCIKNKKGKEIHLECSISLMKTDNKPVIMVIARDVTERKKTEEALKESEGKYRNLFENARNAIVAFDLKGNVTAVNKVIEEYGFRRDEMIGKNMLKFVSKKYWPRLLKELAKISRGKPVEGDIEIATPRGKRIAEYRSNPIRQGKKVVGFQTILRDVTEKREMERKLRQYSQRLKELLETRTEQLKVTKEQLVKAERMAAIGEVAAMVGHDLRNPLQAMVNAIHLAKRKIDSAPLPFRMLAEKMGIFELRDLIEEQVEYMNKIVSDLQDYARPLKPKFVPTKLHKLVKENLSAMKVPENVKVSVKVPNDFPPLLVDPALMKRVFTNLITNALQAMSDGGQLTITASRKENTAIISIQDTGVGIPKEHLPKIFLPLFTTKAKGQGFGLPVCKRLVEAHNGTITVESKEGKGATFTVKIPFRRER